MTSRQYSCIVRCCAECPVSVRKVWAPGVICTLATGMLIDDPSMIAPFCPLPEATE